MPLRLQDNEIKVGGRLRKFTTAWSGDKWAKNIVSQGLRWEWKPSPPLLKELVPQQASEVLVGYVQEMLEKEVVVPFFGKGVQNYLLFRPKKGTDKLRDILNLSHLNDLIPCPSFKMVTVQDVRACLPPRSWLTSLDLRDAYWHVPIAPSYRKFLAFSLPMPNGQSDYAFKAMPFGLNIVKGYMYIICMFICYV